MYNAARDPTTPTLNFNAKASAPHRTSLVISVARTRNKGTPEFHFSTCDDPGISTQPHPGGNPRRLPGALLPYEYECIVSGILPASSDEWVPGAIRTTTLKRAGRDLKIFTRRHSPIKVAMLRIEKPNRTQPNRKKNRNENETDIETDNGQREIQALEKGRGSNLRTNDCQNKEGKGKGSEHA